ncbi:MAG: MBL fold metallo-hydrolase, partial [Bacilli bacterium]
MKLKKLVNSLYEENTYLVYTKDELLIIDPGFDYEEIESFIDSKEFEIIAIYLTHSHFDHIYSVNKIVDKYNCNVYAHKDEIPLLLNPEYNLSINHSEAIVIENVIPIDFQFRFFAQENMLYHVPGHTKGHTMLYIK